LKRELAIALRSPVTWLAAALAALLVGHGFVLSVDLFTSASRSALDGALQPREMDPLSGIVRPTLGGVELAVALLAPIIAARPLAVEKERGTFGALCLVEGGTSRVVAKKAIASVLASLLLVAPAMLYFVLYAALGGYLDLPETLVASSASVLHVGLVAAISVAAAAWTTSHAQAATIATFLSLASWAVDAGADFAALAWLGGASSWSIDRRLAPMEQGIVHVGALLWLLEMPATFLLIGFAGASFTARRRRLVAFVLVLVTGLALARVSAVGVAFDWTEARRASLPPAVVDGLRAIREPLSIEILLDRDDSRRKQLERDVLAKLVLARPDLLVRTPLDEGAASGVRHESEYGRILVRVGDRVRETRSISRREIVTLLFEASGEPLPEWSAPSYAGHPFVMEGLPRRTVVAAAYGVVPLVFLLTGIAVTRKRRAR
jgi:hypothetical protein